MEPASKRTSLNRIVSQLWNELSSAFASALIFASLLLFGVWAFTGDSILSAPHPQTTAGNLKMVLVIMLCLGIAAFLATYTLNCPIRGCAPAVLFSLKLLFFGKLFAFALALVPIIIGGVAGKYFNAYLTGGGDTQLVHTGFRALMLALCVLLTLSFVPYGDFPFWIVAIVWAIKCSIYLSGAIRSIWQRCPDAAVA